MATSNARNGSPGGSIAVREREHVAVQLRIDGLTYDEIGDRLGVSRRIASRIVNRAMNRVLREPVEQLVQLEASRLDKLWAAMWPEALAGSVRAAEVCIRVSERRSRLLGLDQPTRVHADVLANVTLTRSTPRSSACLRSTGAMPGRDRPLDATL